MALRLPVAPSPGTSDDRQLEAASRSGGRALWGECAAPQVPHGHQRGHPSARKKARNRGSTLGVERLAEEPLPHYPSSERVGPLARAITRLGDFDLTSLNPQANRRDATGGRLVEARAQDRTP